MRDVLNTGIGRHGRKWNPMTDLSPGLRPEGFGLLRVGLEAVSARSMDRLGTNLPGEPGTR
jgi:hypothetical protein